MAGIRMSGMYSGINTDQLISDLMKSKSVKKDQLVKKKASIDFKQEAWKGLNAKIYNLYSKTVSDLRLTTSFRQQKTTVSDSSVASVVASSNAPTIDQDLEVLSLSKTANMTGGTVTASASNTKVTGSTKLADLAGAASTGKTLNIPGGFELDDKGQPTKTKGSLTITANTTINDVVTYFKSAGYNASFDEKNGRFYISAQKAGAANIAITSSSSDVLDKLGLGYSAVKNRGTDAKIKLNGAEYTSASNTFEINGLTITAKKVTAEFNPDGTVKNGNPVTLSTQRDTDAVYDTIKKFITQYNALINEMDKLYNAPLNKSYQPLTSEEKSALSEKEVTDWENKVKESVLSRDESLKSITDVFTSAMSKGVTVNGKTMYLSSFGINMANYMQAADNEKHAYHIDGDADDTFSSSANDKLKSMLATDPDSVEKFFTGLMKDMYDDVFKKMQSSDYSSFNKVYNDKQMQTQSDKYEKELAELEVRLQKIEDNYYMKFSKMEKAMAQMQSKQTALAGLLGGN